MSAATHILLTTDFSAASEEAVAKAGEMARATGARLTVLHVHRRAPAAPEAVVPADKYVTSADLDAEVHQNLEDLRRTLLQGVESVSLMSLESVSTPLAICDYAEKHGVDLIVIGTHGRTGVPRLLIGSVAERVVRHASCPVLVVPHGKQPPVA